MAVTVRPAHPSDAEACGRIIHDAFRTISERHHFPPDFQLIARNPDAAFDQVRAQIDRMIGLAGLRRRKVKHHHISVFHLRKTG